jgi:ABC-type branched-subunit amino acid transport system substrate-binding protein
MSRRLGPLLVVLALATVACDLYRSADRFPLSPPPPPPVERASLVVGLVGTLSGPDAWRGEDAFEGADLGVHALNRGRAAGATFELRPLDDGGDPGRAAALVKELAALQATVGIVYAGPPEGLAAAQGALVRARIPGVLCYGDPVGGETSRSHVFQTSPPLAWQAARISEYLTADRGYVAVGAIAEDTVTGTAAVRVLENSLRGTGARQVVVRYAAGSQNLRPLLARLRRRGTEAVVVQGSPRAMTSVLEGVRQLGGSYRSTSLARIGSAPAAVRGRRLRSNWWHPQIVGFDLAVGVGTRGARPGTAAADSYTRGAHYLPTSALRAFRSSFRKWWGEPPLGWEQRAYDASLMIGWAVNRAGRRTDFADVLEDLRGRRFSALPATFGSTDHVAPEERFLGLWVVPRPGIPVTERRRIATFGAFPWVPLARTFARGGEATSIPSADWPALFGRSRYASRPPSYRQMRWGVTTTPRDPVH